MIVFKNKGVIDVRAIKTFGVSVKKENAIGFFGTGLKYAISILLREGCTISIFSGGVENSFGIKKVNVSGEDFDIVCMNGEELGFTTELGKTWKLWQAMRELYCNCTDEGGSITRETDFTCGNDETVIVVGGAEFDRLFNDIGNFILQGNTDISNQRVNMRKYSSSNVYYKGVLVKEDNGLSLFTYDIKQGVQLTEDRTAKYSHEVHREIASGIMLLECEQTIDRIVTAEDIYYEGQLNYNYSSQTPTPQFLKVAKRLVESKNAHFNKTAIEYAKKHIEMNEEPAEYVPTGLEKKMLERAMELLLLAGFPINKYPMKFVEKLGPGVFAQVILGEMFIARECFNKGTKLVAHALLEEYFHIETGHEDETRGFQTFLFDNILTLIERLNQEAF